MQGMKLFLAILGRLIYILVTSMVILLTGGGSAFFNKSIGACYLILWILWWTITFIGRRKGEDTIYNKGQKMLVIISGIVSIPFLIYIPVWEYSNFQGPIPRDGVLSWAGIILFATGIIIQSVAMWQLKGFYTVRIGIQPEQKLITSGLYRFIRHPGYLSYIITIIGIGLALSSILTLIFVIFIVLFLVLRITGEEEMLLKEFGDEYKAYMNRTKKIIPFIY
jgi:protein-S-isoprenylcysteine O-methyltransferase Ste14